MAEEKKSTEKKEVEKKNVEKKAVEKKEPEKKKKFCTNCGKELKDGEVCNCQDENDVKEETKSDTEILNNGININSAEVTALAKDVWNTILNMFKKPFTTANEELDNSDNKKTITNIVLLAISFGLYVIALIPTLFVIIINLGLYLAGDFTSISRSVLTDNINIPYFKIFIYAIILFAFTAIIPMLVTFVIAKFEKNNYDFKKSFKLYTVCYSPMILAYLGMAILMCIDISILTTLGNIAFVIISLVCFFNYIHIFIKEAKFNDDKKSYALTDTVISWCILLAIVITMFAGSIVNNIESSINGSSYDIEDLFDL